MKIKNMRKKTIVSTLIVIASLTAFAQTTEKKVVSFCNHDKTISVEELNACGKLICNDSKLKIKSYTLAISAPVKTIATGVWDSSVFVIANIKGAVFKNENASVNEDAKFILENLCKNIAYL